MNHRVMVIGSSNMDTVIYLDRFASPGETVHATGKKVSCGGKGANQAVAASRAGAEVTFLTALGEDAEGRCFEESLSRTGMRLSVAWKRCDTGQAFIEVDGRSENRIAVIGGANMMLSPDDVERASEAISESDVLVLQNEIPADANVAAMRIASESGVPTVYNPAPFRPIADGMLQMSDYLVMNRSEFQSSAGTDDVGKGCEALIAAGVGTAIVTLGKDGCFYSDGCRSGTVPAPRTDTIDTSGAGDTFVGYLASSLSEGRSLEESIALAVKAASLSCTKRGAMDAIPHIGEIRIRSGRDASGSRDNKRLRYEKKGWKRFLAPPRMTWTAFGNHPRGAISPIRSA
ncbi:MAG: ribokinase [Candidatus Methanomethylophilaceae archaeon]|nr:ribokinase [Candidatus Methanomethylophilaceae archaeon]